MYKNGYITNCQKFLISIYLVIVLSCWNMHMKEAIHNWLLKFHWHYSICNILLRYILLIFLCHLFQNIDKRALFIIPFNHTSKSWEILHFWYERLDNWMKSKKMQIIIKNIKTLPFQNLGIYWKEICFLRQAKRMLKLHTTQ